MSNKTQLQTNNTALDGYITRINAAKEVAAGLPEAGGSSGSGNVNTVDMTFVLDDEAIAKTTSNGLVVYGYIETYTAENGFMCTAYGLDQSTTSITVNNIVCNSLMMFVCYVDEQKEGMWMSMYNGNDFEENYCLTNGYNNIGFPLVVYNAPENNETVNVNVSW